MTPPHHTGNEPHGPLAGIRVLEFEGLGPAPFCGMLLADMGADVILLERPGESPARPYFGTDRQRVMHRGKRSLGIDLKHPEAKDLVLRLVEHADVLIEGFRPGVMERLGIGPGACQAQNLGLIYARVTGWGQDGPLAQTPGHDLNFAAASGILSMGSRHGSAPWAPPTITGDMGGGGALLAFGITAALFETVRSGVGQVIDASMVEGAALLGHALFNVRGVTETNPVPEWLLDSTAPFYDVYPCRDGRWITVAALEPKFYAALLRTLGLDADPEFAVQDAPDRWPRMRQRLADLFFAEDSDHWADLFQDSEACVAPVLNLDEAPSHPQAKARLSFFDSCGMTQPSPTPRFSVTPGRVRSSPPLRGGHTTEVLLEEGCEPFAVERLIQAGAIWA